MLARAALALLFPWKPKQCYSQLEHSRSMEGGSLETALLDQRMRADQHKTNFEELKAQYMNLQELHGNLKVERETLAENYDKLHRKSQEIISTLQQERDAKIVECEELRTQVLTADKLSQLRLDLSEELEAPYRKRLDQVENDYETLRSEYNKLKYSYTFLKSEYEAAKNTHESVLQELKAKHQAEISSYIVERKERLSYCESGGPSVLTQIRQLSRENSELQQRVRALLSEIDELHAQKEHSGVQNEQSQKLQSRQVTELQTMLKTVEIERSSLLEQLQMLRKELSSSRQEQLSLSDQLHQAQRDTTNAERKWSEAKHKHQMALSELHMQNAQRCGELEHALDQCQAELQSAHSQMKSLQGTLKEQEVLMVEKEHDLEQRVQVAREKEWEKQVVLQKEKIELEEKVATMQREQSERANEVRLQVEQLEDKIRDLQTQKATMESELNLAKSQLQERVDQHQVSLKELQRLSSVDKKYQALLIDHRSLQQTEQELQSSLNKLQSSAQILEDHLCHAQEDLQAQEQLHKETAEREKQSWTNDREVLEQRVEEVQEQRSQLGRQLEEARSSCTKLQKHYRKQVRGLKQSLELSSSREKRLALEMDSLKKALTLENQRLTRKLADAQRKQKEFLFLLHNDPFSDSLRGDCQQSLQALMLQEKARLEKMSQKVMDHPSSVLPAFAPTPSHHSSLSGDV